MQDRKMPHFRGRLAFIFVSAGAAVGLGNIWGFTYVAGKNGGGGFVLTYLLALVFFAAPIFIAELALGRLGQGSPPYTLAALGRAAGSRLPWAVPALLGVFGTILILSFYVVIAGEGLEYARAAMATGFSGWDTVAAKAHDDSFKSAVWPGFLWGGLFTFVSAYIVSRDIREGLERMGRYLMPALFILMLMMVVYSALVGDMGRALDFLFGFSEAKFSVRILFEAVGQAFFSVGVGVGGIMILGAYMGEDVHLVRASLWIVTVDLLAALLAGLAIFPLVFAYDVPPAAGPGLVFLTLPSLFSGLPFGGLAAVAFFVMLSFAALTSSTVLMAPSIAWLEEKGLPRARGAWLVAGMVFAASSLTVLSFGPWQAVYPLKSLGLDGLSAFDLIREGVNNIFLPISGFAFALIAGWGVKKEQMQQALNMEDGAAFRLWYAIIRYLVPVGAVALFFWGFWGH